MKFLAVTVAVSATAPLFFAYAHDDTPTRVHRRASGNLVGRKDGDPYPTGVAYEFPPLASITPLPPDYSVNPPPMTTTYSPGFVPAFTNAPPLPACESALSFSASFSFLLGFLVPCRRIHSTAGARESPSDDSEFPWRLSTHLSLFRHIAAHSQSACQGNAVPHKFVAGMVLTNSLTIF